MVALFLFSWESFSSSTVWLPRNGGDEVSGFSGTKLSKTKTYVESCKGVSVTGFIGCSPTLALRNAESCNHVREQS